MNKTNKLAIEALRKQIQKIAFDANLFDRGMADYPYAEECSRKKKKLLEAIAELGGGRPLVERPPVEEHPLQIPMFVTE